MVVDLLEGFGVQAGLIAHLAQHIAHGLRGRLGGAAGKAGDGTVQNIRARLRRLEQGHGAGAGGAVGMDHHGDGEILLQGGDQLKGRLGAHDARHVLDADGLTAHLLQLPAQLHEHLQIVDGAGGIAEGPGHMRAALQALIHCHLNIAQVVQSVEDADDVDAVFHALAHESPDDIVGIMLIAQQVLAPQQHLQLGILHMAADGAQPLPGILVQIAQAAVKGSAAPALQRVISGLIHLFQDGQKISRGHPGRHQRLLRIPQDGFRNLDLHNVPSFFSSCSKTRKTSFSRSW